MASKGNGRIALFDIIRGFTIISMVLFHATYDAAFIYGFDAPWFMGTLLQNVWRASISWVFLFLAGWMTAFSRNNFRRAAIYGAAALAVWAATSIAAVDTPVSFGILFCMATSTLIAAAAKPALDRLSPAAALVAFLVLFAATLDVPHHSYPVTGLAWLGLPDPAFSSGDYYPLVPFTFMYMAGAMGARLFARLRPDGYPDWMKRDWAPVLSRIGRLSLPIYLLHQPLLIVLFEAIVFVTG